MPRPLRGRLGPFPRGPVSADGIMKLRSHLVLLVLAAMLPLLLFTVFIVRQEIRDQHDVLERGLRDTVRALSQAVDREVATA
jgi:hypothetical protein